MSTVSPLNNTMFKHFSSVYLITEKACRYTFVQILDSDLEKSDITFCTKFVVVVVF